MVKYWQLWQAFGLSVAGCYFSRNGHLLSINETGNEVLPLQQWPLSRQMSSLDCAGSLLSLLMKQGQ